MEDYVLDHPSQDNNKDPFEALVNKLKNQQKLAQIGDPFSPKQKSSFLP
jgi:hypothetical protein